VELAGDKYLTTKMLKEAAVPVPETIEANNAGDIIRFSHEINASVVVKPVRGNLGEFSTVNIRTEKEIAEAFDLASQSGEFILAQKFIPGNVYRLLVIDNKFTAAAMLTPPAITGNGKSTVSELIEQLNGQPGREWGDKGKLTKVEIDEITQRILLSKGYTPEDVLPAGEVLILKKSGNPKVGGFSADVTAHVHDMNKYFAEHASRTLGLNVAGVDIICSDISKPINQTGGAIIELNAAPDFRMHLNPASGTGHPVASPLVDMLFPDGQPSHIPVFSVTGSSGKTPVTQLLDFSLRTSGFQTGLANSDGLFTGGRKVLTGDASFPGYVSSLLKDSNVECAILETSKEGILREGRRACRRRRSCRRSVPLQLVGR